MLATNSTPYIFGIPDYTKSLAVLTNSSVDSQTLRAVWVGHLTHEREKAQKAEALRHPLEREVGKKIFSH